MYIHSSISPTYILRLKIAPEPALVECLKVRVHKYPTNSWAVTISCMRSNLSGTSKPTRAPDTLGQFLHNYHFWRTDLVSQQRQFM